MAEEASDQGGGETKRDLGKILLPVFAVLNLAVVGAGAFMAYQGTLGFKPPVLREPAAVEQLKQARASSPDVVGETVTYTMPPFTVNLAGTPRRLIRVEMIFEMLDKEGFEEIVRNSPRTRDEIMRILNRKTFDDVETIQGKLALKDDIAITLNQSMRAGVVKDIYFNEFVIQ